MLAALESDERVIATATGTNPSEVTKAKVAKVGGGMAGVMIARSADRRRARAETEQKRDDETRAVCLTDRRVLCFDREALRQSVALGDITSMKVDKSFSDPFRRVVAVRTKAGGRLAIEGERTSVEAFAVRVRELAHIEADAVREVKSFWLVRAFIVGVLLFFGAATLLLSIPQFSDKGAVGGVVTLAIGVALVCLGLVARRRLLR
jgi:hypothetical protein